ncbi:MAG TPA: hypothetical protein P5080_03985 [Candidatus Paceibacterota bacterium]|nr:hypothetical protein [Candidatus Pacearchaeota archaeon]HRZ51159.1 hypothetical protein [Candidatus Paceibacterota bacterium]HSA36834.1 hypothetical protein [Candidatus Paceibacterota bacterium]
MKWIVIAVIAFFICALGGAQLQMVESSHYCSFYKEYGGLLGNFSVSVSYNDQKVEPTLDNFGIESYIALLGGYKLDDAIFSREFCQNCSEDFNASERNLVDRELSEKLNKSLASDLLPLGIEVLATSVSSKRTI